MKNKRQRINSIQQTQKIMANAHKLIKAPSNIRMEEGDVPFFNSVIAEFARSEWTEHQLELAALLARAISDMENEQYLLRKEGAVLTTDRGKVLINPRKTAVQMHANTILSLRRSLSLHARANGDHRDTAKRRGIAKSIEAFAHNYEDNDLIPRRRLL